MCPFDMSKDINFADFRKPDHSLKPATWDQTFVFDIETMGDHKKTLQFGKPYPNFEEPKYGNMRDPEKEKPLESLNIRSGKMGKPIGGISNMIDQLFLR